MSTKGPAKRAHPAAIFHRPTIDPTSRVENRVHKDILGLTQTLRFDLIQKDQQRAYLPFLLIVYRQQPSPLL